MTSSEASFRLLRSDDAPATNLAYKIRSTRHQAGDHEGRQLPDSKSAFDFLLTVKKGPKPDFSVFGGRYASGPPHDRFVYLSWFVISRGDCINRIKACLSTIDWNLVLAAQEQGKVITADMTGWGPGDPRKYVTWFLQ